MLMLVQNIPRLYPEIASGEEDAIHILVTPHFQIQGN